MSPLSPACALLCLGLAVGPARAVEQVKPGERLSEWLLRQDQGRAFLPGLQWQVPAERLSQENLRRAVVQSLAAIRHAGFDAGSRDALIERLLGLPLTGRVLLAIPDARWLMPADSQNPTLQDGHRIVLPKRPTTVTLLTESGPPCAVEHSSGALIQDYLRACLGGESATVDEAWIVQADGRSFRYGVAGWNETPQDEPGLGAWIWAPRRMARIPGSVSDNLARFLGSQLPGEVVWPQWHADARQIGNFTAVTRSGSKPRAAPVTASDWGEIGLMQTPTARMAEAGEYRFHLGHTAPYTSGTVMVQPLDWLETGFRYTNIANRLYGPLIAGDQPYKDKSIDFKLRIREESSLWPQIAVGMRDVGGTGLFSGEYIVASKRTGNFDWSLGLGWGYLGARGNIKNPLTILGKGFATRPSSTVATGGTFGVGSMFRGPTALFGGLQWHSPSDRWILKIELDGNDYQSEPLANNQPTRSPINIGAVYRFSPNIDLSFGLERGNRLMLGLTLHSALNQLSAAKVLDPALPRLQAAAPLAPPADGWGNTAGDVERLTGWSVRAIDHQPGMTSLYAETDGALYLEARVERTIMVLHRDAPAESRKFVLHLQERGLPMNRIEVDRYEWLSRRIVAQAPSLGLPSQQVSPGQTDATSTVRGPAEPYSLWRGKLPGLSFEFSPGFNPIFGGPDGFMLYRFSIDGVLNYRFSDSTWLTGVASYRILDNYDKFKFDGASNLPRVRTDVRSYETSARFTVPQLQISHVRAIGDSQYLSVYGGLLESMYAGVGTEWLYRPWHSSIAFGVDVNRVRQRGFKQNFEFKDYRVTTGHATMYWDTEWNDVQVALSAGRYLAGDVGATLNVKRTFKNGFTLGAYATKTNVSATQFGEGSFDKGVYLSIPFDAFSPLSSNSVATFRWSPLTRDGGAKLRRGVELFELTKQRDRRALEWGRAADASYRTGEDKSYVLREPSPSLLDSMGNTTENFGRQLLDVPGSTWLWAGGAILASSLLDRPVDNWVQRQGAGRWNAVGKASNAIPWALAIGSGLAYSGLLGEGASDTGETAIKAAAFTLAANMGLRYLVGRSRPFENQGAGHFEGFQRSALKSGFASNHTALAFAMATPFAQQHNMPWLYPLAAVTALGRVQRREHWVSDAVAGALMGYAVGSLLVDQQRGRDGVKLSVTPQSVVAHWSF